jgi:hypothetical protein
MQALILVMPLTKGLPYMLKPCLSNGTGHQRRYIAFKLGIWNTSTTKKEQKNKNDQNGPNTRTFALHSNGTSKTQRTKEWDQKKDTYVRLGLGFLCWFISFPS